MTGYCYGCARTNDEKKIWKSENSTDEWKSKNLEEITKRMKGWQLETFKESYKHKLNNGISLYKKNLLEKNKIINLSSLTPCHLNGILKPDLKVLFLVKIRRLKLSYKYSRQQNLIVQPAGCLHKALILWTC